MKSSLISSIGGFVSAGLIESSSKPLVTVAAIVAAIVAAVVAAVGAVDTFMGEKEEVHIVSGIPHRHPVFITEAPQLMPQYE